MGQLLSAWNTLYVKIICTGKWGRNFRHIMDFGNLFFSRVGIVVSPLLRTLPNSVPLTRIKNHYLWKMCRVHHVEVSDNFSADQRCFRDYWRYKRCFSCDSALWITTKSPNSAGFLWSSADSFVSRRSFFSYIFSFSNFLIYFISEHINLIFGRHYKNKWTAKSKDSVNIFRRKKIRKKSIQFSSRGFFSFSWYCPRRGDFAYCRAEQFVSCIIQICGGHTDWEEGANGFESRCL